MTSLEALDSQVKSVIGKNKLSSSAVDSIVRAALDNVSADTALITLLYRQHKKATPTHKLTSLYLIDAIARGARSKYKKEGKAKQEEVSTTPKDDPSAAQQESTGNCGTFLKKLEGLLSKIVLDVWENAPTEHREKVRKVMDIWTKAGTFSSSALARLGNKLLAASTTTTDNTSAVSQSSPVAPAMSPTGPSASPGLHPPPPTSSNPGSEVPIPANVLALLQATASAEPSEAAKAQQKKEEEERMIQRVLAEAQGLGPRAFPISPPTTVTPNSEHFPPSSSQSQISAPPPYPYLSSTPSFDQPYNNVASSSSSSNNYNYNDRNSSSAPSQDRYSGYQPPVPKQSLEERYGYQTGNSNRGGRDRDQGHFERRDRDDRGGGYDRNQRRGGRNDFETDRQRGYESRNDRGGSNRGEGRRDGGDRWGRRENDFSSGDHERNFEETRRNGNRFNGNGNRFDQDEQHGGYEYRQENQNRQNNGGRWEQDREIRERGREQEREANRNWEQQRGGKEEETDHGIAGMDDPYQDSGFYNEPTPVDNFAAPPPPPPSSADTRAPLPPDSRAPLPARKRSRSPSVMLHQQSTSHTIQERVASSKPPTKKPFVLSSPSNPPPSTSTNDTPAPLFDPSTFSASSPVSWSSFVAVLRENHPSFVAQKLRGEWPSMQDIANMCVPSAVTMFGWGPMGMAMGMGMGMGANASTGGGGVTSMGGMGSMTEEGQGQQASGMSGDEQQGPYGGAGEYGEEQYYE